MPTAMAVSANPTPDCSAGANCTITFAFTGDYYTWVVPAGITSVNFDVQGAQGTGFSGYTGGNGGRVTGTLAVTPGSSLYLYVGGQNGWNGGGAKSSLGGEVGGGASDIKTSPSASYANRIIVAGAGGGAGSRGSGGAGGGLTGASASARYSATGGTQSGGGTSNNGGNPGGFGFGGAAEWYGGAGGGGAGWYGGAGGATDYPSYNDNDDDPGAGGSSYTDASLATNVTHTQGFRTGNGQIIFTYLNAPTVTTFTSSQATPTNTNSDVTYSLTFSQNVNTVASSDFSNAGTATGCVFTPSAASGTTFTLTVSSCSEGSLIPQVLANQVYGTVTSSNGPTANSQSSSSITFDRSAPAMTSVTASANQTYIPTNTISFTANMSETVTVSGSPRLALTIGSTIRYATYASGSNSKALVFSYTVQTSTDDIDVDGIAISTTLELNSGSIADSAANALSALTFTAPSLTSVLVAQKPSAPTIDSISATSGQISINFSAGASNGSAITNYEYSTNNGSNWTTRSPVATTSPIVITGLINGTSYPVRIRAVNGAGAGDSSTAVSATPSAVTVTGGSDISITYGGSASSTPFSAAGGTGSYTWSLSSTPTGVSISGSTVTASNATPAGTYTANMTATDTGSPAQVGSKPISITVSKASSSISISLPGGASSAALGGAVTITAVVSRAGSVNFKLDGTTISGCGAAAAASTTATCTWTPNSLGGVSLTAVFTPTESSNYDAATSSALSVTVVNGVSTITLALAGGVTQTPKGQAVNIIATIDQAGKVSFYVDGKRIPGCFNLSASVGNKTCSWKPAVQARVNITATFNPTSSVYNNSSSSIAVWVIRRSGNR